MIILALLLDGFIFQSGYAAAVSVRTHTDFLSVTWTPPRPPPDTWNVRYQVTGTSYHSALLVPGTQSAANISSTDYPGSLYAVHVFANNNGTRTPYGVGYGRSDCSHTIAASIGETYVLESPGYPYGLPSGVVCVWTVAGTADTWYTVDADDVDINAGGGCGNVLRIDNRTVCGNDTNMRTLYIPSDVMHWTLITKNRHDGRGFRFNVTAVHKIDSPGNVTAATVGQAIHVTWSEPVHHPANFSYIVRVSHYPYTATVDVAVPPSRTQYVVDVGRHAGQMYSIQVQAATDVWSSPYTAAVTVDTACDRDIHIAPTEAVTLTSAQYPFSYLPGIHCRYDITTDVGFYLRLDTADISLAGGPGCRHSYLAVGDYGTFCTANPPDSRHVVASGRVKMEFVTGDNATGRGFNITITAVARPPLPPTGVRSQVGHGELCVTWVPPARRRQYVTGYRLQYWVVPHTPGATLQLPADTRNVTVGTRDHPGRVYVLRVAAVTAGGAGRYSAPTYARASCGSAITLTRHHKGLIISPSGQKGLYQPGVVCKWAIVTDSPLAIKLHFDKLNIESSVNCSKDFLAVTDHGRLCGNMTGREYVIHGTRVELMFATDLTAEQQGFVVSAAAVGPTPGMPTNVTVYRSKYALIISWNPPLLHRAYVSGYILSYTVRPDRRIYTKSLPARDHTAAVDITDWPGRQVHVWMQAQGDIATSNKTETLSFRIACGETINTTHGIFYIASPHYPTAYQNDVYCKWSIDVGQPVDIMLTLIRIDLTNQQNNCTDFLAISGQRRFCDDSHQNMPVAVYSVRSLDVEFHTDTDGVGTGFLLSVEILPHTDTVTTPLTLTSSNGAPSIRPTPSSTFAGPTGALLATSLLTTNAFLNSSVSAT